MDLLQLLQMQFMQQSIGDFNDVVEKYTNKTFLIEGHDASLRSHENLPSGLAGFQTTTTPKLKSSALCPLHAKNCIALADLLKSIDKPIVGKYLLCRSLCPPVKMTALFTIVDDPVGKLGVRISLYNFVRNVADQRPKDVYQYLPVGTTLAIMNPWWKKTADGGLTIRCDNPAEVIILKESMVKEIFGSLTWKGEIPLKYRPKELLAGDSVVDTCKAAGNEYFAQKHFHDAIQAYTNGIKAEAKDSSGKNHLNLLANRSAAYLVLHEYNLAIVDAESVLIVDNNHIKSIFRKAKALFGLAKYEGALAFLSDDVSLDQLPIQHRQIVNDLIVKAKSLILQSQTGEYPWIEISQNKFDELAEFVGPVIVKNAPKKGRGLFATDSIKAGKLILASKAFARVVDNSSNDFFVNMSFNLNSVNDRSQTQLITEVAHILKDSPEKCQELYNLYAGPEFSNDDVPIGSHDSDIDMKRIEAICFYNQFGIGGFSMNRDGKERECGLWLSPSYINHSCVDANSSWFTQGDYLFVIAFHDIGKDEEIQISYMPPLGDQITKMLKARDFICDCRLCSRDRKDSSAVQTERSALIERLETIISKYRFDIDIVHWDKNDDVQVTMILKLLNDLRVDAPELNLFHMDKMELLADVYYISGHILKSVATLESVYNVIARISAFCRLSASINNNIVGAYILLGDMKKVKEWIPILKRNCTLAYGTWKVIEVVFPYTYKTIQALGINLHKM